MKNSFLNSLNLFLLVKNKKSISSSTIPEQAIQTKVIYKYYTAFYAMLTPYTISCKSDSRTQKKDY
ncbi:hypothetical protein PRRU23_19520 [Segatella bryantii]|uniref:Uncharacterized protein n=1 Tax=Segatella bryantii TaxID=77095 RepID=A0AA37MLV0_SEGBR|nr:hypothetical protein PRRU23_19520 [Segatella bryantii]